jgi:hypothetical protein
VSILPAPHAHSNEINAEARIISIVIDCMKSIGFEQNLDRSWAALISMCRITFNASPEYSGNYLSYVT